MFDEEDEKRIAGEEMESAGNETILNGVGLRVVSRDGWLWNTAEIRNLEVVRSPRLNRSNLCSCVTNDSGVFSDGPRCAG